MTQALRMGLACAVAGSLLTVLGVSRAIVGGSAVADRAPIQVEATDGPNPWTSLQVNNNPSDFRFAVISDRTGGHRAKVFSQAMDRINLLQPEFVMSVGDLIEGYTTKPEVITQQWDEFVGYVKKLQMPFFYVPGNHDITNPEMLKAYKARFGKPHYHFVYRDTLFLAVNSEDTPGKGTKITPEQVAYFRKAVEANPSSRWTFIFLHKPMWTGTEVDTNGWADLEKALGDRQFTVFCGHEHVYEKYVRNGRNFYQLATTGGGSRLRGVAYGEFDQIAWVTMKGNKPIIGNIVLDGVLPENLRDPASDEAGTPAGKRVKEPTHPVNGTITLDGKPLEGASVVFHRLGDDGKPKMGGDGQSNETGSFEVSSYGRFDGLPVGTYQISVSCRPLDEKRVRGENILPARYLKPATSELRFEVKEGKNPLALELKSR